MYLKISLIELKFRIKKKNNKRLKNYCMIKTPMKKKFLKEIYVQKVFTGCVTHAAQEAERAQPDL